MPFDGTSYESVSPVTQMLINGKQRLERGWCQRSLMQRESVCILGSLVVPGYKSSYLALAVKLLSDARQEYGYSHPSVVSFNDEFGRTKEQVLEVYSRAIELSMLVTHEIILRVINQGVTESMRDDLLELSRLLNGTVAG